MNRPSLIFVDDIKRFVVKQEYLALLKKYKSIDNIPISKLSQIVVNIKSPRVPKKQVDSDSNSDSDDVSSDSDVSPKMSSDSDVSPRKTKPRKTKKYVKSSSDESSSDNDSVLSGMSSD